MQSAHPFETSKLLRYLRKFGILALCAVLPACGAICDNAGVAVDNSGRFIVAADQLYPSVRFISPNSSLLARFRPPPQPPNSEQVLTGYGGYALSRDGNSLYLLRNTADHPNIVYRIDLRTGRYYLVGNNARSNETWIATSGSSVYQVGQFKPEISRNGKPYILGTRTRLSSPVAVEIAPTGEVCVLESEVREIRCYDRGGNVAPSSTLHMERTGFSQIDCFTFDRRGNYVVALRQSGSSDTGIIEVFARTGQTPRLVRTIRGARTHLNASESLAVDHSGNILTLSSWDESNLLVFDKNAHGNASPRQIIPAHDFPVSHPFRMVTDAGGHLAMLGSDGVAVYYRVPQDKKMARRANLVIDENGWDIAFAAGDLILSANDGSLERYDIVHGKVRQVGTMGATGFVNYGDPDFVATDPRGNVYTVSTNGGRVVELPPNAPANVQPILMRHFRARFSESPEAFAVDGVGRLFFALKSTNSIVIADPDGSQRVLSGDQTGLSGPSGLAVGPEGELFVANSRGHNILVFPANPRSNAAPIRTIFGYRTALEEPMALALDAKRRLYVFDGPSEPWSTDAMHFVRVYNAEDNGDVPPLKTYNVKTQCWANGP
jgi:DNA-binding beta-propeller fold protein YncE